LGYVPTRTLAGNQIYLLSAVLAHNLSRELQMQTTPMSRVTTTKRTSLWAFERLDTLRRKLNGPVVTADVSGMVERSCESAIVMNLEATHMTNCPGEVRRVAFWSMT
jgi:hypothetical protein